MNAILNLVQGSPEWHEHRKCYRNASETPAVMGVSPWLTPYELWLAKTGRKSVEETEAMRYGTATEPAARTAYERQTGLVVQPQVVVDGLYSASLDGITLDGNILVEIKCPFKGRASELWQTIKNGSIPEHYRVQVQHQLMAAKASLAHLWIFDGQYGIKVEIDPDEATFQKIREAWDQFQQHLDTDTPPPLTDQDTVIRSDLAWKEAAEAYIGWKSVVDEAQAKADAAKAKLVEMTRHSRELGNRVTVTRFWKQGKIDYKRIPELQGVDLEQYRGKAREEVRISVS